MNLHDLQAFLAVADQGSFSLAAEQMHLTQPAVSKRVHALESALETRLFDRVGRRVLLTEAGRLLQPRAREILFHIEDSRRLLSNLSGDVSGHLSLATSHHIGLHRLPPMLKQFTERYPGVQVDLEFLDSESACEQVAQGALELALITLPESLPSGIDAVPIWTDPLYFACAPDHPLAQLDRLSPGLLNRYPVILPRPGTYTRDLIETLFHRQGLAPEVGYSTNYLETIKMMVNVGLGWSLLPGSLLDSGICRLELPGAALERRLGITRHRDRTLSNAGAAFLSLLMADATSI